MKPILIALAALGVVAACSEPAPDPTEVPPTADAVVDAPVGNDLAPVLDENDTDPMANEANEPPSAPTE